MRRAAPSPLSLSRALALAPASRRRRGRPGLAGRRARRSAAAGAPRAPPVPAPYDAPPAAAHSIEITIRTRAAREILASLARPRVRRDGREAPRGPARRPIRHPGLGPRRGGLRERLCRGVRREGARGRVRLPVHPRGQGPLAGAPRRRRTARGGYRPPRVDARGALLPGDRPVSARLDVYLSFGVAGLGDHIVLRGENGREAMVLDLARALGDSEGEPLDARTSRIARVIAGVAFRQAWAAYRDQKPRPGSTPIRSSGRARRPAARRRGRGPRLPLHGRRELLSALRLAEGTGEAGRRRLEPPGRPSRGGGKPRAPHGADHGDPPRGLRAPRRRAGRAPISSTRSSRTGLDALREALQEGPKAFFLAYERACDMDRSLPPLSRSIRDQLAGGVAEEAGGQTDAGEVR